MNSKPKKMSSLLDRQIGTRRKLCVVGIAVLLLVLSMLSFSVSTFVAFHMPTERGTTLDRVLHTGELRVGATLDYAPFSMECLERAGGADIEMAGRLAASLNAKMIVYKTTWSSLIQDAKDGHFDIAVGGISITLQRLRAVAMSRPLLHGGKVVVAPCGSPCLYEPMAALNRPSTRVAVNPGGTNEDFVRQTLGNTTVQLVAQNDQFHAILHDQANFTVTDDVEAKLQALRYPGALCAALNHLETHDRKAYLLPQRSDVPWAAYVNAWLESETAPQAGAHSSYNATLERWLALSAKLVTGDATSSPAASGASSSSSSTSSGHEGLVCEMPPGASQAAPLLNHV